MRPMFEDQDDARDERYVSRFARMDAGGSITSSDARARDHFATGDITDAMDALTVEDYRAIQARRWRGRFF